jgi:hypothetical protein
MKSAEVWFSGIYSFVIAVFELQKNSGERIGPASVTPPTLYFHFQCLFSNIEQNYPCLS